MENLYDDDEMIDKYLAGQLPEAEAKVFDEKMKNEDFRKEVALRKELLEVVEYEGNAKLKAMLQAEESGLKIKSAGIRRIQQRRLVMAAAVLLLLLGAVWWLFLKPAPSDVFAENFEPYRNTLELSDRGAGDVTVLKQAFRFYENKDYEKALAGFEIYLQGNPDDDVAFYQANAMLAMDKTAEAAQVLEQIIEKGTTVYLDASKWYLALAYARLQKVEAAKSLLMELQNSPFYKEKAGHLLRQL